MSDLSSFTGVFRITDTQSGAGRRQTVARRNRTAVSCTSCRSRKLKCDRQHPCGACSRRGNAGGCHYSASAPGSGVGSCVAGIEDGSGNTSAAGGGVAAAGRGAGTGIGGKSTRLEVQLRLQKLEEMVSGLMQIKPPVVAATSSRESSDAPRTESSSTGRTSGTGSTLSRTTAAATTTTTIGGPSPPNSNVSEEADDDDEEYEAPSTSAGHFAVHNGEELAFTGATHWAAILESIHGIRSCLEEAARSALPWGDTYISPAARSGRSSSAAGGAGVDALRPPTEDDYGPEPDLLFGSIPPMTMREVVHGGVLPPRHVADRIVAAYFSHRFTACPFVHPQRFRREYEEFWLHPPATSFLWVSMLFSVLAIGAIVVHVSDRGDGGCADPEFRAWCTPAAAASFQSRANRCLVAGEYLRGKKYSVEALLLTVSSRHVRRLDQDGIVCSRLSMVIRLAQRMGYHRDPAAVPGLAAALSPFDAEMRRRAWLYIEAFDVLFSFQAGMPTIVHEDECDVAWPGNYDDDDLAAAEADPTVALPPHRPDSEHTPNLYYSHKSRVIRLLRRVFRHALSTRRPSHAETRRLNADVVELRRQMPESLRWRPVREAAPTDTGVDIIHRMVLETTYLKMLCVLHRAYLAGPARHDPRFRMSRATCRAAALRILDLQAEFDAESRPGGRLHADRHLLSGLMLHDFLLAAMILCLDLCEPNAPVASQDPAADASTVPSEAIDDVHGTDDLGVGSDDGPGSRERKISALRTSYAIWQERQCTMRGSREAAHATRVLGAILGKVEAMRQREQQRLHIPATGAAPTAAPPADLPAAPAAPPTGAPTGAPPTATAHDPIAHTATTHMAAAHTVTAPTTASTAATMRPHVPLTMAASAAVPPALHGPESRAYVTISPPSLQGLSLDPASTVTQMQLADDANTVYDDTAGSSTMFDDPVAMDLTCFDGGPLDTVIGGDDTGDIDWVSTQSLL